jgi:hypothetical protein
MASEFGGLEGNLQEASFLLAISCGIVSGRTCLNQRGTYNELLDVLDLLRHFGGIVALNLRKLS